MAEGRDYEKLSAALVDLRDRLLEAESALALPPTHSSLAMAALNLRKMLEGVALFSFVVNRGLLESGENALRKSDANQARKAIAAMNPEYWPKPQMVSTDEDGTVIATGLSEGFVTSTEWGRLIGMTSEWLHWRNPYEEPLDLAAGHRDLSVLLYRLETLTRAFTMSLPADSDLLLCSINAGRPGDRSSAVSPGVLNLSKLGDEQRPE